MPYSVQNPSDYSNSVSIYSFGSTPPLGGIVNDTYQFSLSAVGSLEITLGYSERYAQFPEFGYFELSGSGGALSLSNGVSSFSKTNPLAIGSFDGLAAGDYSLLVHIQQSPTIDSNFNYQLSLQSMAQVVSEPESLALLLVALGLMGAITRYRRGYGT